jgi:hypothetical protein
MFRKIDRRESMKKIFVLALTLGLLSGCSVKQSTDTTVIYKRDLYGLVFEWASYREAAIVAYAKLHHVSRHQAEIKVDAVVKDVKQEKFEDWYQNQREQGKL